MAVARCDLAATAVRIRLALTGVALTVTGYGGSWLTVRLVPGAAEAVRKAEEGAGMSTGSSVPSVSPDSIGIFGDTPAGMLASAPHSEATLSIVAATGVAILVITACLAAMDAFPRLRLLAKTLAREAGISRACLYRTWGHLKDEFEKRRTAAWAAGQQPDPREARITRLRDLNQRLTGRLARTHTELTQLKERQRLLLSVLAAKDDELQRLRRELSTLSCTSLAPVPKQQEDASTGVLPMHRT